jgi:FdhE protein
MSSALDGLVRQHPELGPAASILRVLATALPEARLPEGVPHPGAAQARLASGIPALHGEPLLSGAILCFNVRLLANALQPCTMTVGSVPEALEHAVQGTEIEDLAFAAQEGAWDVIEALAERIGLDGDTLVTLVDYAVRPTLREGARAVRDVLAQSRWTRGTCPSCGATPLLAELRGGGAAGAAEHERVLRCGRCLSQWSFPRLRCVSCGETDHRHLSYLHSEGEGDFRRADVCDTCHSYVKSVAVLSPLSLDELLGMDLVTAALDLAAVQHGFHRA